VKRLFHIARIADWEQAQRDGVYRVSTLGKFLDDEGFIHLSFAHQVKQVADSFYRGMTDLVLLELDHERLGAPVGDRVAVPPPLPGDRPRGGRASPSISATSTGLTNTGGFSG
jgi:uncharacterized protein (DUF952 family)